MHGAVKWYGGRERLVVTDRGGFRLCLCKARIDVVFQTAAVERLSDCGVAIASPVVAQRAWVSRLAECCRISTISMRGHVRQKGPGRGRSGGRVRS